MEIKRLKIIAVLGLSGIPIHLFGNIHIASAIPTMQLGGARVPNWSQMSFSSLPPLSQGGSFSVPPQVINQLGFDPSRSWTAGTPVANVITLGSIQELGAQQLSLGQILGLTGGSISGLPLSNLQMMQWQSISNLTTAIPGLSGMQAGSVRPIADLLTRNGQSGLLNQSIGSLASNPAIANLRLGGNPVTGQPGVNLSSYGLNEIPGLANTPLQNLENWEAADIAGVGGAQGLQRLLFSQFPGGAALMGTGIGVGKVDVAYGPKEARRTNVISGSNRDGSWQFRPCNQSSCAYLELTDIVPLPAALPNRLHGRQWISGNSQQVPGGYRPPLNAVNGGQEPTGRHPFGETFKLVLTNVTESRGEGEFQFYGRVCIKIPFYGKSCTPYFIPLFPWIPSREKDPLFIGPWN